MRLTYLSAIGVMLLAAACGGGPAATTAPTGAAEPAVVCEGSGGTAATIVDFAFNPTPANAAVGSTVTWTNQDSAPHTVTFSGGPDCGTLNNGGTASATFSEAGTFDYSCTIHPTMRGQVVVQ